MWHLCKEQTLLVTLSILFDEPILKTEIFSFSNNYSGSRSYYEYTLNQMLELEGANTGIIRPYCQVVLLWPWSSTGIWKFRWANVTLYFLLLKT